MKARSDDLPVLLVDTREQRPLQFSHLPAESATLYTGDYSVRGLEEQAARLVETWAFCEWREAMKPAGVSLPFPDWAVGVLCPRYNAGVKPSRILSDIEGGKV